MTEGLTDTKGSWKESDDSAEWSGVTKNPIRTKEDALRSANVDENVWRVDRFECNAWTVVAKDHTDTPRQYQNYQVKIYLKRIFSKCVQQAQDAVFEKMRKYAPKFPKGFSPKKCKGESYLVVAGLFDAHFGKYAWGEETGTDYEGDMASAV